MIHISLTCKVNTIPISFRSKINQHLCLSVLSFSSRSFSLRFIQLQSCQSMQLAQLRPVLSQHPCPGNSTCWRGSWPGGTYADCTTTFPCLPSNSRLLSLPPKTANNSETCCLIRVLAFRLPWDDLMPASATFKMLKVLGHSWCRTSSSRKQNC